MWDTNQAPVAEAVREGFMTIFFFFFSRPIKVSTAKIFCSLFLRISTDSKSKLVHGKYGNLT